MMIRGCLTFCVLCCAMSARADILAQCNFNSLDNNAATGTLSASTGAGTIGVAGGATTFFGFGTGSSDSEIGANDSAWGVGGFPSQGVASGTVGIEGSASTVGYQQVLLSLDQKGQPSSNKFFQVQARVVPAGAFLPVATYGIAASDVWENAKTFDVTSVVPAAANNPNFAFRVVAVFEPNTSQYAATSAGYNGNISTLFDMVTVQGVVPEPSSLSLGAIAAVAMLRRRRNARSL